MYRVYMAFIPLEEIHLCCCHLPHGYYMDYSNVEISKFTNNQIFNRDFIVSIADNDSILVIYFLNIKTRQRYYQLYLVHHYSTGVQIVSCTLSDDSVLSESTGLFNPVLCVSQWNLFWQKNQPMRLCLSNQVRSARESFPSPLGDFIRLFEGLIGELFQIWHWNMFYFF